ncbi:hypothetical protein [Lactobacillus phage Lbab1]|nr:hypothetical protein [Lactobacillus phage Lbab1]
MAKEYYIIGDAEKSKPWFITKANKTGIAANTTGISKALKFYKKHEAEQLFSALVINTKLEPVMIYKISDGKDSEVISRFPIVEGK